MKAWMMIFYFNNNNNAKFRIVLAWALFILFGYADVSWGGPPATINQDHFRWRNDNGDETGATWKANVDTAISGVNDGEKMRIRVSYYSAIGTGFFAPRLEFSSDATSCTDGTRTATTTSTTWKNFDSTQYDENGPVATTQQISSPAGWVSGGLLDLTNQPGSAVMLNSPAGTEYEWAVQANGVAGLHTYYFRVTKGGTPMANYSQCASLTTAAAVVPFIKAYFGGGRLGAGRF